MEEEEVEEDIEEILLKDDSSVETEESKSKTSTLSTPMKNVLERTPFSAVCIREEKEMVCFISALKKMKQTSPIWSAFRTIESTLPHDPKIDDFPGLRKIESAQQNNKDIVVACKLCYDDETKPLRDCLATCYQKQVSNAKTHLRYKHPELLQSLEEKKEPKDDNNPEEVLPVYKQKSLLALTPKAALDNLHYLIYCFINNCGISTRNGCNNKLYYIINYAV